MILMIKNIKKLMNSNSYPVISQIMIYIISAVYYLLMEILFVSDTKLLVFTNFFISFLLLWFIYINLKYIRNSYVTSFYLFKIFNLKIKVFCNFSLIVVVVIVLYSLIEKYSQHTLSHSVFLILFSLANLSVFRVKVKRIE